jgi:hypothetical protein
MGVRRLERMSIVVLLAFSLTTSAAPQVLASTSRIDAPEKPAAVFEFGPHTQVIVDPLVVGYTREFMANRKKRKLVIRGRELERIRRHYHEVIMEKLGSNFVIASQPGPRVVRVEAYLVNHEFAKHKWRASTTAFRGAPRFHLAAYLRDSRTGLILDSAGMTLSPVAGRLMKESRGYYWQLMRSAFDQIATELRVTLEDGADAS